MAIDISTLEQLPVLYPDLIIKKVYEDTLLYRFPIETTTNLTPGPYRVRIFDPVAHLSKCCQPYNGNSNITEKDVEVICLKDGQTYCEDDLARVIRNADFRFTAGQESAGSLQQVITEGQLYAFLEAIDKLLFQGDTTSADTNLNLYDGLLKQAIEDGGQEINVTTGNLYTAIVQGVLALPEAALKMGTIAVFVPERYGLMYQLAFATAKLLYRNDLGDMVVPGLDMVTIIPTRGLTGLNQMLITPLRNVRYLTNRKEDLHTYEWKYIVDKDGDYYIWRVKTLYGIMLVFEDYSVVLNIDESVVSAPIAIDVNIVNNPLNVAVQDAAAGTSAFAASASLQTESEPEKAKTRTSKKKANPKDSESNEAGSEPENN